jgi:hypothetical protein
MAELKKLKSSSSGVGPLDPTYDRVMESIYKQPQTCTELALRAFSWLTKAQRTLSFEEFQQVISVEPGQDHLDEADQLVDKATILDICGSLVTIDEDTNTVRLAHYTVQEYLLRNKKPPDADFRVAIACTTYLSLDNFITLQKIEPLYHRSLESGGPPFLEYIAPSVQDRFDRKPALHYAIQHRRSDHIIQLLLEKGADPSIQDRFQRKTALHYAIHHRRSDHYIQLLLENGVDIAIRDSYGCTALHLAIEFFDPEKTATSGILRTLLRHGANPLDTDNAGKSPLEYANDHIRPHVADIIREEMSKREGHVPEILISHTDAPAPCPRTTEASKKRLRTDNLDNPENGAKRARSEEIEQVEAQMLGEFPKGHFLHILS